MQAYVVLRFVRVTVGLVLVVALYLTAVNFYRAVALAQSTSTYSDWMVNELSRRVTNIESEHDDARIKVLESNVDLIRRNIDEMNLMLRSVAGAVLGQLAFAGISFLKRGRST